LDEGLFTVTKSPEVTSTLPHYVQWNHGESFRSYQIDNLFTSWRFWCTSFYNNCWKRAQSHLKLNSKLH